MEPLFSASPSEMGEASSTADVQLLADGELMSLWEQTQIAVAAIEGRGGSASTAKRYERAVLMELQKRAALLPPGALFGHAEQQESPLPERDAAPHIMVMRA